MRLLMAALLLVGLATTVRAVPLDLTNPTSRSVRVEIDQEIHDFAVQGGAYSLPMGSSFSSNGALATVTVPESAIEAFIDGYFDGAVTAVHGTFSDYIVTIDVATHEILSAAVTGTVNTIVGPTVVTQTASSTALAGFTVLPFGSSVLPLFCAGGVDCTIVPGQPYDAQTGQLRAVGVTTNDFLPLFSPFGDLRLSEAAPLECDTSINGKDFIGGEAAKVGFSLRSNQAINRAVEIKVWIERGDGLNVAAIRRGADGTQPLTAGQFVVFPAGTLFVANPSLPLGNWAVGCRVIDPVTGDILASDRDVFKLLAARP